MKDRSVPKPGVPKTGPWRYDTSRELKFGRPARVGATPFWDRPTSEPQSKKHSNNGFPLPGNKKQKQQHEGSNVLPMS
jgi:hypothetical protein